MKELDIMRTGLSDFQPKRLTQAREALGMTKTALAEKVDCSAGTISKWENGQQSPEASSVVALSAIFKLPVHWFTAPVVEKGESTYFFRSQSSSTKTARSIARVRLKWLEELSTLLQQWVKWPALNLPAFEEQDFRQVTDEQIDEFADHCRQYWRMGGGPLGSIMQIVESAGIICARDFIGQVKMDGVSAWMEGERRPYILVVADKSNCIRSRFDISHELGHILMHRNVSDDDFKEHYKLIESQADRFAGAFMLPAASFSNEVRMVTLDNLLALKSRWKVSIAAMIKRCEQLDLIDEYQKLRLWKNLSARGWRTKEPLDDAFTPETPKLLGRAIQIVLDHGLYDKESLLTELCFDAANTERLTGLTPGYFMGVGNADNVEIVNFKRQCRRRKASDGQVVSFPKKQG